MGLFGGWFEMLWMDWWTGPVMDPGPEVVAGEDKIRRRK